MSPDKVTAIVLPRDDAKENFVKDVASTWDISFRGMAILGALYSLAVIVYIAVRAGMLIVGVGCLILILAILLVPLHRRKTLSSR